MYNQDVIDRLNNLTNLYALKNANIKVISKKNEFGDVVKFFAQINSENVIQRITYKASGCTTFVALCSYFCEIVEGNTISKATKIDENDLMKFSKLDDSKTHVYKIILDTFALLIKKYNDGIKKGKIKPCEPIKITDVKSAKKEIKKSKKENKTISNSEILSSLKMYASKNTSAVKDTKKSSKASSKAIVEQNEEIITTIISQTKQKRTKSSLTHMDNNLIGSTKNEAKLATKEETKIENSKMGNSKMEVSKIENAKKEKVQKEHAKKEKANSKKSSASKNSEQATITSANITNQSKSMATKDIVTDDIDITNVSVETKKLNSKKDVKSARNLDKIENTETLKKSKKDSSKVEKTSKSKKTAKTDNSLEQRKIAKQDVAESIVVEPETQEKTSISQEVELIPSQNTTYEQNVEIIEPTQDSGNQLSTISSQDGVVITTAGQKRSTIQVKRTITTTSETKRSQISSMDNGTYVETKKSLEHARFLERSTQIARLAEMGQSSEKKVANEMKLSHLTALNETIKNKETNEKMKNNSNNLNSILDRIKLNSINNQPKEIVESKNEVVVESAIEENKTADKETKENETKKDKKNKDKPKKEKKSLFSWFKK